MQAYEFYAKPSNGVISLPDQYRNTIKSKVKVIILEEDSSKFNRDDVNILKRTDLLSPISIDTRGWKFDKEEANER